MAQQKAYKWCKMRPVIGGTWNTVVTGANIILPLHATSPHFPLLYNQDSLSFFESIAKALFCAAPLCCKMRPNKRLLKNKNFNSFILETGWSDLYLGKLVFPGIFKTFSLSNGIVQQAPIVPFSLSEIHSLYLHIVRYYERVSVCQ